MLYFLLAVDGRQQLAESCRPWAYVPVLSLPVDRLWVPNGLIEPQLQHTHQHLEGTSGRRERNSKSKRPQLERLSNVRCPLLLACSGKGTTLLRSMDTVNSNNLPSIFTSLFPFVTGKSQGGFGLLDEPEPHANPEVFPKGIQCQWVGIRRLYFPHFQYHASGPADPHWKMS